jgi:hypothetical protein
VSKTLGIRLTVSLMGLALGIGVTAAPVPAALDMVVGARNVVKNEPVSSCNAKAKAALTAVLQSALEVGTGDTGEWKGIGPADSSGNSFAAAAIHCYPLDEVSGYLVTITCAAQTPPNPDTASAICDKLSAALGAQP